MKYKTEQERFWAGEFGASYLERNNSDSQLACNLSFFSKALMRTRNIKTVIEFGANIGMNLKALKHLLPGIEISAIEINPQATKALKKVIPKEQIFEGSIFDYGAKKQFDLVLIKGVLIHVNPEYLKAAYQKLIDATRRYLLVAEYYNPTPLTVSYRGHGDRLFKRDFAAEILDTCKELSLLDYGFVYHKDPVFPQDDITWFLLEKI